MTKRQAAGWMAVVMALTMGVGSMGEVRAQGMGIFPVEESPQRGESRQGPSTEQREDALRQGLSNLRERSSASTTPARMLLGEQNRSVPPVRSLQTLGPLPEGRSVEPTLTHLLSAESLNPWEVCQELIFLSHSGVGSVITAGGDRLARIDSPTWSKCEDGILSVGSDTHHLSTFDRARGDWVHARLEMPRDLPISDVQVQEIENWRHRGGAFLVDVRTGTEVRLVGIWSPGQQNVELHPTPFAGISQVRDLGDRLRVAWVDYSENRAGERYLSDMSEHGLETLHRQVRGQIKILEDGWAVTRRGRSGQIISPQGDVRDWDIQGCSNSPQLRRTLAEPAGALMSCDADQDGVERFKYWQPSGSKMWSVERHDRRSSSQENNMMSPHRPVASRDDCPGALEVADQTESAVIIKCLSQDPGGAYRFQYHWSEFIDLESGDWWRTSTRDIHMFGPDGRLLVTDRSAGADYHWQMGSRLYITEPMVNPGHRRP